MWSQVGSYSHQWAKAGRVVRSTRQQAVPHAHWWEQLGGPVQLSLPLKDRPSGRHSLLSPHQKLSLRCWTRQTTQQGLDPDTNNSEKRTHLLAQIEMQNCDLHATRLNSQVPHKRKWKWRMQVAKKVPTMLEVNEDQYQINQPPPSQGTNSNTKILWPPRNLSQQTRCTSHNYSRTSRQVTTALWYHELGACGVVCGCIIWRDILYHNTGAPPPPNNIGLTCPCARP